ncbi:MAG TPA: hemerythrin domain-containing protein [Polyangiaceae bacterium]|nr:hemerythrin domain-containing protein [Polyangiaceae bacterium]
MNQEARRSFLTLAGASTLLAACRKDTRIYPEPARATPARPPEEDDAREVGATEDLMREHGVIRRILVVYRLSAARLRSEPTSVPLDAVQRAAKLMHGFGEEYHEKQLEEAHLFPAVRAAGGAAAAELQTLLDQHRRGREITDYILVATQKPLATVADPLARVLDSFALMYEEHAAREDTIVFPAWKKALSPAQLDEMGELFEDIEHRTFGKDGFDDAVQQVTAIEHTLSLVPGALTAPPPPKL